LRLGIRPPRRTRLREQLSRKASCPRKCVRSSPETGARRIASRRYSRDPAEILRGNDLLRHLAESYGLSVAVADRAVVGGFTRAC